MATTNALLKSSDFDLSIWDTYPAIRETDLPKGPADEPLLGTTTPDKTEERSRKRTYDFSIEVKGQPQVAQAAAAPAHAPAEVLGTTLEPLGDSVLCELTLQAGPHRVRLPGALFPKDTVYGAPFTLRMTEESGIRKPLIELRARRNDDELAAGEARVAALIAELEND